MDLTPRTSSDNAPLAPRKRNRKWKYVAMLVVVVSAGGFIVSQFLTSAIDFYCNVDELGSVQVVNRTADFGFRAPWNKIR